MRITPMVADKPLVSILIVADDNDDFQIEMIRQLTMQENIETFLITSDTTFAAAANRGLKAAVGEYIIFVDGRDRISMENLKTVYQLAKCDQLDFIWISPICGNPPIKLSNYIPSASMNRIIKGAMASLH